MSDEEEKLYQEYMKHLEAAQIHAQRALDALYEPEGPKRRVRTRIMLGRAQSILMGLYVLELKNKPKD